MSSPYQVNITQARLVRHGPRQGLEAAAIDVAQDLLLRHLHDVGLLSELAFKGGTALRKLYAGAAGRFSLDLDFSVAHIGGDTGTILRLLAEEVEGLTLGPFTYGLAERRGKRILLVNTALATTGALTSKLDVNPPPWLEPVQRGWVPMPIHDAYGGPLPQLTTVRLEENIAEKVARLNRTTTARDVRPGVGVAQLQGQRRYQPRPGTQVGRVEDLGRRVRAEVANRRTLETRPRG